MIVSDWVTSAVESSKSEGRIIKAHLRAQTLYQATLTALAHLAYEESWHAYSTHHLSSIRPFVRMTIGLKHSRRMDLLQLNGEGQ